jgi:hypothetical protein
MISRDLNTGELKVWAWGGARAARKFVKRSPPPVGSTSLGTDGILKIPMPQRRWPLRFRSICPDVLLIGDGSRDPMSTVMRFEGTLPSHPRVVARAGPAGEGGDALKAKQQRVGAGLFDDIATRLGWRGGSID